MTLAVATIGGIVEKKLKRPELALDADESQRIAQASANLLAQFEIPIDNPKTAALVALVWTTGGIYAAKFAAIGINNQFNKAA